MTEVLWHWPELCNALGVEEFAGPDITGISIDSRTLAPGDLFIAMTGDPGPRFNPSHRSDRDGHDFIAAALERGAAGVLSHDPVTRDCAELKVDDTLEALWRLGRAARARLTGPIVAITGSSGKTTTKTWMCTALQAFATAGSLNNHLGVPLSLARTPRTATAAVYEIGTNHPGEIAPLSGLVRPDVAVVLNVHPAHAENFADLVGLRTEKLSIYKGLTDKGVLVVEDLIDTRELPATLARVTFGDTPGADVRLVSEAEGSAEFEISGNRITARVPGGGGHRARSLAAVLAVLKVLDRDLAAARNLDAGLVPKGRGNPTQVGGITLIDDSYNANPASMAAALQGLQRATGRRFALLGEMLELGEGGIEHHARLARYCSGIDYVYCVGAGMRPLSEALDPAHCHYQLVPDDALLELLCARLQPGDTLLVKGSNRVFWARGFVDRIIARLSTRVPDSA
ncbi:MAG: UDP-N-acetylmuramoyl-tripeptide--D-alanyl-D-alanine ligase [Pseudomonadales bacterium]